MHPGKINREILEFIALISIQIGGTDSLKNKVGTIMGKMPGLMWSGRDDYDDDSFHKYEKSTIVHEIGHGTTTSRRLRTIRTGVARLDNVIQPPK